MTRKGVDFKLSTTDSVLSFLAMYMPATAGFLFWLFVPSNSPLAHRIEPVSSHAVTLSSADSLHFMLQELDILGTSLQKIEDYPYNLDPKAKEAHDRSIRGDMPLMLY